MAVSHGYSKITTSGSVFAYDLGDTFNSYKGEPTTNLLTVFPTATTLPTTMVFNYEYSCSIENAPVLGTPFDNEKWVKFVKTSAVNGRATFLNISGLVAGGAYTWTAYTYVNDSRNTSLTMGSDNGAVSATISNTPYNFSRLGTLQRMTNVFTSLSGSQVQGVRGGASDAIGSTFYMTGFQCEYKDHATQLVSGTRSVSGSIIDVSGYNRTVNAVSGGYNSQARLSFNGSSNVLDLGNFGTIGTQYSIECIFNSSNIVSYRNVYDMNYATYSPNTGNVGPRLEQLSAGAVYWIWSGNTTNNALYIASPSIAISPNQNYHTVFTMNSGSVNTYFNGNLANSNVASGQGFITSFQDVKVGRGFVLDATRFFSGSVDVFRVYDRVLTEGEVLNNYYHYKTRFNLP